MKVLVAAASKHGATDEIAVAVADVLAQHGLDVRLVPADDVESVRGCDAVVLGSAVYMGRWLEAARRLVDAHADELSAVPVWLFSSGPVGDPPRPADDQAVDVTEIVAATRARGHRLFAGKLDRESLGFGERALVRALGVRDGDYRDWDVIRGWAAEIADALRASRRTNRPRRDPRRDARRGAASSSARPEGSSLPVRACRSGRSARKLCRARGS